MLLYATLGSGEAFSSGREFSAYLRLTPKQYSSGGKINLVGMVKEPKTAKDKRLMALVDRAGYGKASVALANKNVRTAWAMLTQGTEYRAAAA